MEKTYLIQLDNSRVKTILASSQEDAVSKAEDEYEGAEVTGVKELGETL